MSDPFNIGRFPVPYAPIVIRLSLDPEDGNVNVSLQTSPLLNKIESPGSKDDAFILDIVCQGLESEHVPLAEVPVLVSKPLVASTQYVAASALPAKTKNPATKSRMRNAHRRQKTSDAHCEYRKFKNQWAPLALFLEHAFNSLSLS